MKQIGLSRKGLEDITKELIHNLIKSQINTLEQSLLIEALNLMLTIQGAPVIEERYKPALPISTINRLSQKLQDYVEGLFAGDNDVDTEKLTDQIPNFPPERQP